MPKQPLSYVGDPNSFASKPPSAARFPYRSHCMPKSAVYWMVKHWSFFRQRASQSSTDATPNAPPTSVVSPVKSPTVPQTEEE